MKKQKQHLSPLALYKSLSHGFNVELPSGVTVKMRVINMGDFVRRGEVPAVIQDIALRMYKILQNNKKTAITDKEETVVTNEEIQLWKNYVISQALIDPPTTDDPDKTDTHTLYVEELPYIDREAIFEYALSNINKAVAMLAPLSETSGK